MPWILEYRTRTSFRQAKAYPSGNGDQWFLFLKQRPGRTRASRLEDEHVGLYNRAAGTCHHGCRDANTACFRSVDTLPQAGILAWHRTMRPEVLRC